MKTITRKLLGISLVFFTLFSCARQPETIVIDDSPEAPQNQPQQDTTSATTAEFKQLIIGEPHPITTLDPLFADNNSAKRAVQVLYEGLVRYNQKGEVIPAIAKQWRVTNDSLTYLFTLKNDLYYHDSEVFSNGLGRKVIPQDVKYAFERMAGNDVPDNAAQLFMSIDGFEPYFNEQHNVLNPAYRELNGVNGVLVPNDSTVAFRLAEHDPHFLQKLASPYASIYPREAVGETPQNFSPVGSGPFEFSQQVGDSVYVFAKNDEYGQPGSSVPILNRVDILVEENESQLMKSLASGEVHMIPEAGPEIVRTTISDDTTISPAYASDLTFLAPGGSTTYSLKYNPNARASATGVRSLFARVNYSQLIQDIPNSLVQVIASADSVEVDSSNIPNPILSTYSEDPYQRWFLQQLSKQWAGQPELNILRIRTPSRETALYTDSFVPYYPGQTAPAAPNVLVQYLTKQSVLSINEIEQLQFNRYPWWINLRMVNMPEIDQL